MFFTNYNVHQSIMARRSGHVARTLVSHYEQKREVKAVVCMDGYILQFGPALLGPYFYSSTFISLV
jgi:hypothetical protein